MKKGIVVTIHSDVLLDDNSPKQSKKFIKKIQKKLRKTLGKRVLVLAMRGNEFLNLVHVK